MAVFWPHANTNGKPDPPLLCFESAGAKIVEMVMNVISCVVMRAVQQTRAPRLFFFVVYENQNDRSRTPCGTSLLHPKPHVQTLKPPLFPSSLLQS